MLANNKYNKYIVQYCVRKKYTVRTSILFLHFLDRIYRLVTKSEYFITVGREIELSFVSFANIKMNIKIYWPKTCEQKINFAQN